MLQLLTNLNNQPSTTSNRLPQHRTPRTRATARQQHPPAMSPNHCNSRDTSSHPKKVGFDAPVIIGHAALPASPEEDNSGDVCPHKLVRTSARAASPEEDNSGDVCRTSSCGHQHDPPLPKRTIREMYAHTSWCVSSWKRVRHLDQGSHICGKQRTKASIPGSKRPKEHSRGCYSTTTEFISLQDSWNTRCSFTSLGA